MIVSFASGDAARYLLAFFLLVTGLTLAWALLKLASLFGRLSSFLASAESEVLPVIQKVGGSVDRVNSQLDKLDTATDSAVDAVEAVDRVVRTLSHSARRPIERLSSGAASGWAALRGRRGGGSPIDRAGEGTTHREAGLEPELRDTEG